MYRIRFNLWVVKYNRPILVKHRWIAEDVSADCLYHLLSICVVCVDERVRLLFMAVVCRVCILSNYRESIYFA